MHQLIFLLIIKNIFKMFHLGKMTRNLGTVHTFIIWNLSWKYISSLFMLIVHTYLYRHSHLSLLLTNICFIHWYIILLMLCLGFYVTWLLAMFSCQEPVYTFLCLPVLPKLENSGLSAFDPLKLWKVRNNTGKRNFIFKEMSRAFQQFSHLLYL